MGDYEEDEEDEDDDEGMEEDDEEKGRGRWGITKKTKTKMATEARTNTKEVVVVFLSHSEGLNLLRNPVDVTGDASVEARHPRTPAANAVGHHAHVDQTPLVVADEQGAAAVSLWAGGGGYNVSTMWAGDLYVCVVLPE